MTRIWRVCVLAFFLMGYLLLGFVLGPIIGWISYQHERRSGFLE